MRNRRKYTWQMKKKIKLKKEGEFHGVLVEEGFEKGLKEGGRKIRIKNNYILLNIFFLQLFI